MHHKLFAERRDKATEILVDQGLCLFLLTGNLIEAARFMRKNEVPIHVATRVLFNPQRRRQRDWNFAAAR